jgi:hypothetical protein
VCAAHARRYFEELSRAASSASAVATEAMRRWARIYHAEAAFAVMDHDGRRQARQQLSKPLWEEFEVWLRLQRTQVLDGSKIAQAIDYSLNAWAALTLHLDDGAVAIDNNLIERQIKPWKLGANNVKWPFMRSRRRGSTRLPCMRGLGWVEATSHNHSACRNFIRALGGRYRAGLISGGFSLAKARSFIARSASTYMCVVDGLSCPSHNAISH